VKEKGRIRVRIKVKSRIRIRIRIKVKSRTRIGNTAYTQKWMDEQLARNTFLDIPRHPGPVHLAPAQPEHK
jgi:hypothetical protein